MPSGSSVYIDGSQGEGGGQVLRSSLTLSILTGRPVQIGNIRARRQKPGLRPQHLKAVDAAAAISKAQVEGAILGSKELSFHPSGIRSGRYKFDIGTAGATTLVLQTIFLPLSFARSTSSIIITGGTHVPWSPSFHYLDLHWLRYMQQIGFNAESSLDQAGFYPQGGGRLTSVIRPAAGQTKGLHLNRRGELLRIQGISAVANLDLSIANRQKRQALMRMENLCSDIKIKTIELASPNKGTFLFLIADFEYSRCCYNALGELGKPAERVADEAVDALISFLDTGAAVDQYLADQLLLPLSFCGENSEISTSQVTGHQITNAAIIQAFLPVTIQIKGQPGLPGTIEIFPETAPYAAQNIAP